MTFYKKQYTKVDILSAALLVMRMNDRRASLPSMAARANLRHVLEKVAFDNRLVVMLLAEGRVTGGFDYYRLEQARRKGENFEPDYVRALVAVLLFGDWSNRPWRGGYPASLGTRLSADGYVSGGPAERYKFDDSWKPTYSSYGASFRIPASQLDPVAPAAPPPPARKHGPVATRTRELLGLSC